MLFCEVMCSMSDVVIKIGRPWFKHKANCDNKLKLSMPWHKELG